LSTDSALNLNGDSATLEDDNDAVGTASGGSGSSAYEYAYTYADDDTTSVGTYDQMEGTMQYVVRSDEK
jgi:hypothetical protein